MSVACGFGGRDEDLGERDIPTAPSPVVAPANIAAKPGGSGPPTSVHDLVFGPPIVDNDGIVSPGHVEATSPPSGVQGWITGPDADGEFKASASGVYSLTVTDVAELPDSVSGGDPCTEPEQILLRDAGLLGPGTSVSGNLSMSVDEDRDGLPTMTWTLADIAGDPGSTWVIKGGNGANMLFRPQFAPGSTSAALTLTLENGRAHFFRYAVGARRYNLFIGCRVDFTMTMTRR
jgi:hypothetical protein